MKIVKIIGEVLFYAAIGAICFILGWDSATPVQTKGDFHKVQQRVRAI